MIGLMCSFRYNGVQLWSSSSPDDLARLVMILAILVSTPRSHFASAETPLAVRPGGGVAVVSKRAAQSPRLVALVVGVVVAARLARGCPAVPWAAPRHRVTR